MPTQVGPVKIIDSIQLSGELLVTGTILELLEEFSSKFIAFYSSTTLHCMNRYALLHHTALWL